jgi:hypothetical protein
MDTIVYSTPLRRDKNCIVTSHRFDDAKNKRLPCFFLRNFSSTSKQVKSKKPSHAAPSKVAPFPPAKLGILTCEVTG